MLGQIKSHKLKLCLIIRLLLEIMCKLTSIVVVVHHHSNLQINSHVHGHVSLCVSLCMMLFKIEKKRKAEEAAENNNQRITEPTTLNFNNFTDLCTHPG